MSNYNKVIMMGRLTRDPQLKYLPSQMAIVEFGLASSRKFKTASGEEREEVCFVECTSFGKQADVINKFFTKGKPIFIEGRLKFDSWEDKQGGGKRSKHTIVIDRFEFVGDRAGGGAPGGGAGGGSYEGGQDEGGGGGGPPARSPMNRGPQQQSRPPAGRPAPQQQSAPPPEQPYGDEEHFKEDDIPF